MTLCKIFCIEFYGKGPLFYNVFSFQFSDLQVQIGNSSSLKNVENG